MRRSNLERVVRQLAEQYAPGWHIEVGVFWNDAWYVTATKHGISEIAGKTLHRAKPEKVAEVFAEAIRAAVKRAEGERTAA